MIEVELNNWEKFVKKFGVSFRKEKARFERVLQSEINGFLKDRSNSVEPLSVSSESRIIGANDGFHMKSVSKDGVHMINAGKERVLRYRISVIFVSSLQMRFLNREFRKKDEPTDVLSFNLNGFYDVEKKVKKGFSRENRGTIVNEPSYLMNRSNILSRMDGEVYVCLDFLRNQGRLNVVEVLRMIVHGFLHIYGYDHKEYFAEAVVCETYSKPTTEDSSYMLCGEAFDKLRRGKVIFSQPGVSETVSSDKNSDAIEEMFSIQELILNKILEKL